MKKVTVSAPGRVFLAGEYTFKLGKPALLTTISRRIYVTLESNHQSQKKIILPNLLIQTDIDKVMEIIQKHVHIDTKSLSLAVAVDDGDTDGLGFTSAFIVALTGALQLYQGQPWDASVIHKEAYKNEKTLFPHTSGVDTSIITYGGLLWYREEFEFLKTVWLLPFKLAKQVSTFVLVGIKDIKPKNNKYKSTKNELIKAVQGNLSERLEQMTKSLTEALHGGDKSAVRYTLGKIEEITEKLSSVSEPVRRFVSLVKKHGGVARTCVGDGVRTYASMLLCLHEKPQVIIDLANQLRVASWLVELGGEGIRREQVRV